MEGFIQLLFIVFIVSSIVRKFKETKIVDSQKTTVARNKDGLEAKRLSTVSARTPSDKMPQTDKQRIVAKANANPKQAQKSDDFVSLENLPENKRVTVEETTPAEPFGKSADLFGGAVLKNDLVHAIVMSEILGKPKALRR